MKPDSKLFSMAMTMLMRMTTLYGNQTDQDDHHQGATNVFTTVHQLDMKTLELDDK